jgi:inosine-uridine nucleoside N-ribohydrolase
VRLLIDTDTASDDAVALLLALRTPGVRVEAIAVVAGNVPVEQGVQNALYTVELAGADTPVYAGRTGTTHFGHAVHGDDGMGDIGLPLRGREPAPGDAVDALERAIRDAPGELTLVTLGPLTNVAALLERGVAPLLRDIVIMGGTSDDVGNVAPHAEYNVWADPDAARTVFASGAPITMVGWDVSRQYAVFDDAAQDELRALGPLGAFSVDIQKTLIEFCRTKTKLDGYDLPDPIAMAVALDRTVATETARARIEVDPETAQTHLRADGEPQVDVVTAASRERFVALLRDALRG